MNLARRFIDRGLILTQDAYAKFLEDGICAELVDEFLDSLKESGEPLVTKDVYADFFYPRIEPHDSKAPCDVKGTPREEPAGKKLPRKSLKVKHIPAKDVEPDIKVLKDVYGKSDSEGKFDDFLSLFRDRYKRLSRIFREHSELRNYLPIKTAKTEELKSAVKVVALVQDKKYTKNGNIILELEDMSGQIKALISTRNERLLERAKYIIRDEVIGISGMLGEDIIFVNDFQFPDVSIGRSRGVSPYDINAVFTSDVHIGSNEFAEKSFLRFLKWLRLETGSSKQQELASKIKYIVVGGDVVDGIGVYPGQEKELSILDVTDQYKRTAELFSLIPDWIEIVVAPGNHDATRGGNPQMPILKTFAYDLYELDSVHMVSNPSFFSLSGVKCLVYHGDSIFDFLSEIPGFELTDPIPSMVEMLRKRHLAPSYGKGTQIIPEPTDFLAIDEVPDIFQTGHTHINGKGAYRGVTLLNSGGWQTQTGYQKMRNIVPDVAKVPIVNLQSHNLTVMNFGD